jgi:hypothetical protein
MENSKYILTLWKKLKKDGDAFYSGKLNLGGIEKDVTVWIDREAMSDPNCKRPAIKIVEAEPYQPRQQTTQDIPVDEIPF